MAIKLYLLQSPVFRYTSFVFFLASAFPLWSVPSSNSLTHKRLPWIHFRTLLVPSTRSLATSWLRFPNDIARLAALVSACITHHCNKVVPCLALEADSQFLSTWKGITKLTGKGWPRKFRGWQHCQHSWSCTRGPIFCFASLLRQWCFEILLEKICELLWSRCSLRKGFPGTWCFRGIKSVTMIHIFRASTWKNPELFLDFEW
jgi:hypothetical protein